MFFSTTVDGDEKNSTTHVDHAIADSVTPVAIEAEIGGLSLPMNLRKKHLVASLPGMQKGYFRNRRPMTDRNTSDFPAVIRRWISGIAILANIIDHRVWADEPDGTKPSPAIHEKPSVPPPAGPAGSRAEAHDRAVLLHELTHETLLAMHVHYYREDERLLLPATTMRGVFDRWGLRQKVRIRWLAVDAEPMNIEHRPKTDFEHAAVKALKSGERYYEELASGQYSYAGPIRLTSECLKCHVPNRTSLRDRLAGIVIEMPVAIP